MQKLKNSINKITRSNGFMYTLLSLSLFGFVHAVVYIVIFLKWLF